MSEREKDELKKKKIELKEKKFMFEAACKFTSLKAEGSFFVSDPLSEASLEVISAIGQELQSYATKTISSKKNN
jgi:hypothetical protein